MYNTTIAKLLAKENIEVQYGNYNTAWFDIEARTLGLPLWKDMGKDVHDLLVGHEVGHALFTPYEGWHDSPTNVEKLLGCPRSYINVVEDARIERKIRTAYPGLVGPMSRGYKVLADEEFFGDISDVDFDSVKLIDKINLKAKLQNLIEVPFNNEEATLYNKTMNTESFEEVIEVVKEILAYTKENTPELIKQPEPQPEEDQGSEEEQTTQSEDPTSQGHDDAEAPEKRDSETKSSDDQGEDLADGDDSDESDEEESESDTEEEKALASKTPKASEDEDVSLTDMIFRDSEERLLEQDNYGSQILLGRDRGKDTIKSTVISYETLKAQRAVNAEYYGAHDDIMDDYKGYMHDVKKTVAVAVKEFEMKKAAFQWQRAGTAKTGQLNTDMVHAYKTSDDIFKRVTHLADAKNHGMIMVIDYSGSMMTTMHNVLDQLIHLSTFCKAINIPFDVYAFTTGGWREERSTWIAKDGEIDMEDLKMPHLISSTFKKSQFEEALQSLYKKMKANSARNDRWDSPDYKPWNENAYTAKNEEYGSTPLDQALIVTHHLVREFRGKHNIDKMNVTIISDGDSNGLNVARSHKLQDKHADTRSNYGNGMKILIDRKITEVTGYRSNATKCLLESLQKRYGVTTLGFFIAQDSSDWRSKIDQITSYGDRKDLNKQYNKNKVAVVDNIIGYNKFFLLKGGKNLAVQSNDMDEMINEDMSTAQIRAGFKKFAKGKKNSKVLMKQIGGVVA